MKRFIIGFGWFVSACVAVAGTGTSNEFRVDTRTGVRTAAVTEKIQYSTAWATNLTASGDTEDATHEIKAIVKVNPCLKTPPKYLVVDMSGGRSAARWPISSLDEVPSGGWTDEYKTEKLVLRYIPAGSFIMGGRATDYPGAVNTNLHMVTLTKPFYIGVFECTQRQWELAMGTRPSRFSNEACYAIRPVENVSIREIRGGMLGQVSSRLLLVDDASFMGVVRRKTGLSDLDLASEAQWEFACRAGTTTALNNGKNIPSLGENDTLNEVSRNCFNSGWIVNGKQVYVPEDYGGTELLPLDYSVSDELMTSRVGAYQCNGFGLYDMHGNVWEYILDNVAGQGGLDPIGWSESSDMVGWCGGSFEQAGVAPYVSSRTDFLGRLSSSVEAIDRKHRNVGFRICLHTADRPILESSDVLVNASGASAVNWTPTQAGVYQLTHEVQMDGTTVAPMESAFFTVVGPELEIVPQGELTNGVAVKVEVEGVGVDSGWQVYYTTDGSIPTAGSTKYEGPFALPESATVKAVAISAGGVSSEVASKELALHPALAVEETKARQRWPWNGKVDIDCEITGDATKKYAVTFSVEDEIGHTNLTIKTVTLHSTPTPTTYTSSPSSEFVLPPGRYRFTWDAAADLSKGTRFGGVSVSIDAEPSPMADWKRMVTISTDGYAGNETLTDVPVLVRLSSAIEGFDYADFAAPDTGADMIFTDMEGVARYPYEIDEWHKDGESLVWVKLPELKKGTKFKLAYGWKGAGSGSSMYGREQDETAAKHEVWRGYAGVWHMNEDSGTAFDSTEHGLDALPSCGTNKLADVSQMVAYENGACGRARVNATQKLVGGNMLVVPSYDALALGGVFMASAWVDGEEGQKSPRLFSRKNYYTDKHGWEVCLSKFTVRAASSMTASFDRPSFSGNWIYISVIFDGCAVSAYTNGVFQASETLDCAATDNGRMLSIGGLLGNDSCNSFVGWYDEIRLRGGSLSAARIKADYDMIAKRDFCTYGKVEAGPGADPVPPSVHSAVVTFNPNGGTLVGQSLVIYKGDSVVFGTMPTATKDGYSFRGWGRTADATEVVKSTDLVPASGCELFALWDAMTYTVKFNANGGTGTMANEVFEIGVAKALTANVFTRDGYTFDGWATSADGAKVYSDKEVVSNLATTQGAVVNLYAVWKGALYMVVDLSGGASATTYPVSYLNAVPSGGWSDTYKTTKLVLRRCDPGTFMMQGKRSVTLTKTFYIAIYEMTVGQDKKIAGRSYTDYHDADALTDWDRYADSLVSYNTIRGSSNGAQWPSSDAVDSSSIIGKLRSKTSLKFDLPTEAQWEYACRAGKTALYNDGTSDGVGLGYFESRRGSPTIVGKYKANAWGVYDMHGNVLEHVLDWYEDISTTSVQDPLGPMAGTKRACRGGSFSDCKSGVYGGQDNETPVSESGSKVCTSNSRVGIEPDIGRASAPDYTSNRPELGFRVVVNQ